VIALKNVVDTPRPLPALGSSASFARRGWHRSSRCSPGPCLHVYKPCHIIDCGGIRWPLAGVGLVQYTSTYPSHIRTSTSRIPIVCGTGSSRRRK